MNDSQFRALYRQFLFRMVDLDLLSPSAQGDIYRLFGQFAAVLVSIGLLMGTAALFFGAKGLPSVFLSVTWTIEHYLISITMLAVAIFAVLGWDSTFPTKLDVMALVPLPIRTRTIFLAKIAGVGTALLIAIGSLHFLAAFLWPPAIERTAVAQNAPAYNYEPAIPLVDANGLQSTLDRDLRDAIRSGPLSKPGAGMVVGVWKNGVERVFTYGAAKRDSLIGIGSITKTFTGLALAQLVDQGKVHVEDRVRNYLPEGLLPESGKQEIKLYHLVTHHSGLPGMPDNFQRNEIGVGEDYGTEQLFAYLKKQGLALPKPHPDFLYSNLGMSLLGLALAREERVDYPTMLRVHVTGPLGLHDTTTDPSPEQSARVLRSPPNGDETFWNIGAFAPAGAILSTGPDMIKYLEAQLHPPDALKEPIRASHQLREDVAPGMRIAMSWIYDDVDGYYWHNGAIVYPHDGGAAGHTAYAYFHPKRDEAVVVLVNLPAESLAGMTADHIRSRFTGLPAVSLSHVEVPGPRGLFGYARTYFAYWFTMLAAGTFIFGSILSLQGLAAQFLPRRYFLTVSSALQMLVFATVVIVFVMAPPPPGGILSSAWSWCPSYWFLGMFQQLSGSGALAEMARRAWIGLGVVSATTAAAYTLSYFRTIRKIVEEPDIQPSSRRLSWLPPLGDSFHTAIAQFGIRGLLRSRRHRMILAYYLGISFAFLILVAKSPELQRRMVDVDPWHEPNPQVIVASVMLMVSTMVGVRVLFAMPLDLKANWLFRVSPVSGGGAIASACRRALHAMALVPALLVCAAYFLALWPARAAWPHLALLTLLGFALTELCVQTFPKIPFTCSYLPGKTRMNVTLVAFFGVLLVLQKAAEWEYSAFTDDPALFSWMLGALAAAAVALRWRSSLVARSPFAELQFEDELPPAIQSLGLNRDGAF